jgi:hypothetical protein
MIVKYLLSVHSVFLITCSIRRCCFIAIMLMLICCDFGHAQDRKSDPINRIKIKPILAYIDMSLSFDNANNLMSSNSYSWETGYYDYHKPVLERNGLDFTTGLRFSIFPFYSELSVGNLLQGGLVKDDNYRQAHSFGRGRLAIFNAWNNRATDFGVSYLKDFSKKDDLFCFSLSFSYEQKFGQLFLSTTLAYTYQKHSVLENYNDSPIDSYFKIEEKKTFLSFRISGPIQHLRPYFEITGSKTYSTNNINKVPDYVAVMTVGFQLWSSKNIPFLNRVDRLSYPSSIVTSEPFYEINPIDGF